MQIVIDIPKDIYDFLKSHDTGTRVDRAIPNGIVLPKGHGKLIDENEIDTVVDGVFSAFDKYSPKTFLDVIHEQCIEAVGADYAEGEDEVEDERTKPN